MTTSVRDPLVVPSGWRQLKPLIRRRRGLGISQGQLGCAAGLGQAAISRYESGAVPKVTNDFVLRYRKALDQLEAALRKRQTGELATAAACGE